MEKGTFTTTDVYFIFSTPSIPDVMNKNTLNSPKNINILSSNEVSRIHKLIILRQNLRLKNYYL